MTPQERREALAEAAAYQRNVNESQRAEIKRLRFEISTLTDSIQRAVADERRRTAEEIRRRINAEPVQLTEEATEIVRRLARICDEVGGSDE